MREKSALVSLGILFLFGSLYHLLGNGRRYFLVMIELHGEVAPTLGHGTQINGVSEKLSQGGLRSDTLQPVFGIHTEDTTALLRSPMTSPIYSSGTITSML